MPRHWVTIAGLVYAFSWLIVVAAFFIVPRNRKPGSATAWLMLIVLVPYIGLLLFLLIGSPKLSRRRRAQQRTMDALISERVSEAMANPVFAQVFEPSIPERFEPFVTLNANLGGMPAICANRVELLHEYDEAIVRMAAAVDAAKSFVHVEFYILCMDAVTEPFFAALENAVRRGVTVRVLADHMGTRPFPGRDRMCRRMTEAGIEWRWMLPVRPFSNHWNRPDLRNHRKLVVLDGRVGFTGSMNMIDRSYHRARNLRRGLGYVELIACVTGPIADELNAVFLADWYAEGGALFDFRTASPPGLPAEWNGSALCQVLPSGSGYDNDNNLKLFTSLIHGARRRLAITTPYFVPDDSLLIAITSAAQRGVEVSLFSSAIGNQFLVHHAQRSYYETLLAAGVNIHLLPAPALLHAKHMSIDDDIAVIGSSNLDLRSLTLNLEITLIAFDEDVVARMRRIEEGYRQRSSRLNEAEWRSRPLALQLFDNLARLTAALQ
jgi:cardiolipin synthase A/B